MAMTTIENAQVACVTIWPAIIFDAGGETYRIEMEPLEVWRLRMFLDALLTHFPERDFEQEHAAKCAEYNDAWLADLRSRSNQPASTE